MLELLTSSHALLNTKFEEGPYKGLWREDQYSKYVYMYVDFFQFLFQPQLIG